MFTMGRSCDPLLYNEDKLFDDIEAHNDAMYKELFEQQDSELDTLTVEALEIMMHRFVIVLERQLHDQLPGGEFSDPSEELLAEARHVPKSNSFGESVFGVLDRLLRERPAATTLNVSATWSLCRTSGCLGCVTHRRHPVLATWSLCRTSGCLGCVTHRRHPVLATWSLCRTRNFFFALR